MQAKHLINMTPPPTGCPIGTVVAWMAWSGAISSLSSDWMIANGGTLSVTLYPELYQVIGNAFGGTYPTFALPNLTDRKFLEFSTMDNAGVVKSDGLPNITGYFRYESQVSGVTGGMWYGGAFVAGDTGTAHLASHIDSGGWNGYYFNANKSNSKYGRYSVVQPYSMTVIPIIKVK